MTKLVIVTASRAEYGILKPLINRINKEPLLHLQVVVTGSHLLKKFGNTQKEIYEDGIQIYKKIEILEEENTPYDISVTMANALSSFAEFFRLEHPNLLIVLGDRTEILAICCAAMNERIPIAHLHGGELTEGLVDECVRHSITKMSYLHFPATEIYRKRIIQMGEEPNRVFNVGALGVENIMQVPLLSESDTRSQIGIPMKSKYVIVTLHPVTLENKTEELQVNALLKAMKSENDYFYLVTKANSDTGGDKINNMFEAFSHKEKNVKLVSSLGMLNYLSAVKYSEFVLGNSSSGIIEAPALGVPSINIGERQKGRLMAKTVISCKEKTEDIVKAIRKIKNIERKPSNLYGMGDTSEKIVNILKEFLIGNKINLKKKFYDL